MNHYSIQQPKHRFSAYGSKITLFVPNIFSQLPFYPSFLLIFVPHLPHHSSQSPSCLHITAPSLTIFHSLEIKWQKKKTWRVDGSNTSYKWMLAFLFLRVCLLPSLPSSKNLHFSHWEWKQPWRGVWFWTFFPRGVPVFFWINCFQYKNKIDLSSKEK